LEEEGATEEEIESELNLIRAQLAYAYQCIGSDSAALEIYNEVLKQK
jgi:CRISPR/Cas system CSM-associated protein Csm2 small subunit